VSPPHPELETERLRLRQFRETDLDAYARITGDADTMRYIARGQPFDRDEAWRSLGYLLGHWQIRGYGLWAVEEKQSGALIGRIGLYRPEGWPGLEVGWLVARDRWGEGLATEGAHAALDYAFTVLGEPRAISAIAPENAASIRVAEKLGLRYAESRRIAGRAVSIYEIFNRLATSRRSSVARGRAEVRRSGVGSEARSTDADF
jgi:RimJ/RimL family protein N-acetyltransferase